MKEFMELVEQMRPAQKHWLMESKRLENKVDAEIVRCKQGQMQLL